ncbi:MAG: F0F1 ATP synthase subunit A [Phycisphaerales bacterium]|nr:F0F1 ATP synthase subunit A [Phycisphaerales bacterium]
MFMWPLMVPVEILGTFIKPFALAIRLFANMTGGHLVIAVFLSFVPVVIQALGPVGYGMAIAPLLGAFAINMLEILVGFIQAYIFTFLTCLFLGQLVVHEHEEHEEHHDEHGHEDAHAHKPAVSH